MDELFDFLGAMFVGACYLALMCLIGYVMMIIYIHAMAWVFWALVLVLIYKIGDQAING